MSLTDMGTLAAIAVTGAFCGLVLRERTPELALLLALVTGALLLWKSWTTLVTVVDLLDTLAQYAGLEGALMQPVFRTLGIAILVRLTAQLCRDAGLGSVAAAVELAGSGAALAAVSPLVLEVMELVGSLV